MFLIFIKGDSKVSIVKHLSDLNHSLIALRRYRLRELFNLVFLHPLLTVRGLFGQPISDFSKDDIFDLLPDNPVIVEAGCADGTDTLIFAQRYPKAKIIALEPLPELFEIASAQTSDYSNVQVYKLALSNESDQIKTLFTGPKDKNHQSSSLLVPSEHDKYYPETKFEREVQVETISLKDLLMSNDIDSVDLLWLDLQGYELLVLEGAKMDALKEIRYIHTEVSRIPLYKDAPTFNEIHDFLTKNGFKLLKLRMPLVAGNALFYNMRILHTDENQ